MSHPGPGALPHGTASSASGRFEPTSQVCSECGPRTVPKPSAHPGKVVCRLQARCTTGTTMPRRTWERRWHGGRSLWSVNPTRTRPGTARRSRKPSQEVVDSHLIASQVQSLMGAGSESISHTRALAALVSRGAVAFRGFTGDWLQVQTSADLVVAPPREDILCSPLPWLSFPALPLSAGPEPRSSLSATSVTVSVLRR